MLEKEVTGGVLQFDPSDGNIRFIDDHGDTEGSWEPGDEDYDNYRSFFPEARFAVVQQADGQVIGAVRARPTLQDALELALALATEQTDIDPTKLRAELEADHWVADPDDGWAVYVTDLTD